jgi:hypothetical protein
MPQIKLTLITADAEIFWAAVRRMLNLSTDSIDTGGEGVQNAIWSLRRNWMESVPSLNILLQNPSDALHRTLRSQVYSTSEKKL